MQAVEIASVEILNPHNPRNQNPLIALVMKMFGNVTTNKYTKLF